MKSRFYTLSFSIFCSSKEAAEVAATPGLPPPALREPLVAPRSFLPPDLLPLLLPASSFLAAKERGPRPDMGIVRLEAVAGTGLCSAKQQQRRWHVVKQMRKRESGEGAGLFGFGVLYWYTMLVLVLAWQKSADVHAGLQLQNCLCKQL